jgi:hypothetical protein
MPLAPQCDTARPRKRKGALWVPPLPMRNKRRKRSVQGADPLKQPALPPRPRLNQQKVGSHSARQFMSLHTIAAEPHDIEALLERVLCWLVPPPDGLHQTIPCFFTAMTLSWLIAGATSRLGVDHGRKWSAPHPCKSGVHNYAQQCNFEGRASAGGIPMQHVLS